MRVTIVVVSVVLVAVQAACGTSESARSTSDTTSSTISSTSAGPTASATAVTSSAATGSNQPIAIYTTGHEMVLGLAHDTVYMGLSDSLLAKTRADMAKDRSDTGGMGGAFADMVKKTVGNALGKRVTYPISDIQSVRYDNGEIKFDYRNKHAISFESVSASNGSVNKKALSSFAPADAQRFVAAVNAALRADDSTQ